jgi:hypothetical protein
MYESSLGININIWWGTLILIFGLVMLLSSRKPGPKNIGTNDRGN